VLGTSSGLTTSNCYGHCMTGPIAGVFVTAKDDKAYEVWSTQLTSIAKTDPLTGRSAVVNKTGASEIYGTNWWGGFQSEYGHSHPYGALDNTRKLADGTSMVTAIYEAFISSSTLIGLAEQYGPGIVDDVDWMLSRKFKTKYAEVQATVFCTDKWASTMSNDEVAHISKIFKFHPGHLLKQDGDKVCQHWNPDDFPVLSEWHLDSPCFSGRATHLEPVLAADALVSINYQSKGVLVMQNAKIKRLECASWANK